MNSFNSSHSIPDIAVVICTYNPNQEIFSRVLNAIAALVIPENWNLECVIVDNNSTLPIIEIPCVKNFLKKCSWAKVINETQQGVAFARITGVNSTQAPIIIFIDDDNEVDKEYLIKARYHYNKYSCVSIWGPGKITVEFVEPVPEWFVKNFSKYFLEKDSQHIQYGCIPATWTDFYPYGAGLIIKRETFTKYNQNFKTGKLSSISRTGSSLSSCEDTQIVWEAVKMGSAVGVSPELKINHLIPSRRANLNYIRRLSFGTSSSFVPAIIQSFPITKNFYQVPSIGKIFMRVAKIAALRFVKSSSNIKSNFYLLVFDLIEYIGFLSGVQKVTSSSRLKWIYILVKLFRLE